MGCLRIAHITDIHITPQDNELLHDVDVRKNFGSVLNNVKEVEPDAIVIGGDLAALDGELESYRWIKQQLDQTGIEYHVMAGNHDRIDTLSQVFKQKGRYSTDNWHLTLNIQGRWIYCLDSSSYSVPSAQLKRLSEDIENHAEEVLLFIHHPPMLGDCLFMDSKYPLANWEEVFSHLESIPQIKKIICGHYHTEKTIQYSDKLIFITPSTFCRISESSAEFEVASNSRPGWRWIKWKDDVFYSGVEYI